MSKQLDIVIFGATGITGKNLIPVLAKMSMSESRVISWGIAGRSEKKLRDVLKPYEQEIKVPLGSIPIIVADVDDQRSLNRMARQARVIINCCGPFRFFGEAVVRACIEESTHHVDVSGEVQFIEEMQLKYHKKAQGKGVYIISACGVESIPTDLGIVFMQESFTGTLNSIELYTEYGENDHSFGGSSFNYGSWESALYVLAHAKELKQIRTKLFPQRLPKFEPRLKMKLLPRKVDMGWVFPLRTTDRSIVERTQRLFYEIHLQRPVQFESYFTIKTFTNLVLLIMYSLVFLVLSKFSLGRKLLLKYPELFSNGLFSHESPNKERLKNSYFTQYLFGQGWKEKLPNASHQCTTPPDATICAKIEGPNPAYGSTCVCLAASAITILTETEKLPRGGGVYPPGYAFAKTSLMNRLIENGIKWEIVKDKKLFN